MNSRTATSYGRSQTPFGTTGPGGDMTLVGEFQPKDFGGERTEYIAKGVVGDPAVNHYYKVVAVSGAGGRSIDSREEAEFDFTLVPGSRVAGPRAVLGVRRRVRAGLRRPTASLRQIACVVYHRLHSACCRLTLIGPGLYNPRCLNRQFVRKTVPVCCSGPIMRIGI